MLVLYFIGKCILPQQLKYKFVYQIHRGIIETSEVIDSVIRIL